uniref:Uncharacterized protein n=1 Tax=Lotus japonicus TaxID=34305 RepID=I3S106_LOTJA|nr:unknown [Lotus japonicus]
MRPGGNNGYGGNCLLVLDDGGGNKCAPGG